jgi:hypothetical protein
MRAKASLREGFLTRLAPCLRLAVLAAAIFAAADWAQAGGPEASGMDETLPPLPENLARVPAPEVAPAGQPEETGARTRHARSQDGHRPSRRRRWLPILDL